MARIAPDVNDIIVWLLSETSGNYKNTGSFLPDNAATNLSISGTVIRTATGIFGSNCPYFPGIGNHPSGASATRNYIFGANNVNPAPPFSVSCWVNLRGYNASNNTHILGKSFRDHTVTSSWALPFYGVELGFTTGNGGIDNLSSIASGQTTQTIRTITDFPVPLHQWSHIGMTHDGSNIRSYLNGCQLLTYSGTTQLLTTATTLPPTYHDVSYAITSSSGATFVPGVDNIGNSGDEVITVVNLPFPFTIYDQAFTTVSCSSNGFIEFGSTANAFGFSIPNGSLGICVFAFENDGSTSTTGFGIFTTTTGVVGSRKFIIEFRNRQIGNSNLQNSTIVLSENSTTFEIIYGASTSANTGAIGIQSNAGGKSTVFSNSTTIPASGTKLTFTPTVSASGSWHMGAVPATGSGNKEESNYSIQDVRIANVVRPLSYFQHIYRLGALPVILSLETRYYKLRAYDLGCAEPTPVTWVDTEVSFTNAPALPCTGPYSSIEIMDTWLG